MILYEDSQDLHVVIFTAMIYYSERSAHSKGKAPGDVQKRAGMSFQESSVESHKIHFMQRVVTAWSSVF
jgi:hypothetical protein